MLRDMSITSNDWMDYESRSVYRSFTERSGLSSLPGNDSSEIFLDALMQSNKRSKAASSSFVMPAVLKRSMFSMYFDVLR